MSWILFSKCLLWTLRERPEGGWPDRRMLAMIGKQKAAAQYQTIHISACRCVLCCIGDVCMLSINVPHHISPSAPVLPEPVWAHAIRSRPAMPIGME